LSNTINIQETTSILWTLHEHGNTNFQEQEITIINNLLAGENNYITPNNDGVNDYLVLKNIAKYPINNVQVFTRSGKPVYKQLNETDLWNHYINIDSNERVPRDVYY